MYMLQHVLQQTDETTGGIKNNGFFPWGMERLNSSWRERQRDVIGQQILAWPFITSYNRSNSFRFFQQFCFVLAFLLKFFFSREKSLFFLNLYGGITNDVLVYNVAHSKVWKSNFCMFWIGFNLRSHVPLQRKLVQFVWYSRIKRKL